jgi:hypothetical protein
VYTKSNLSVGSFGITDDGRGFVWCSYTGSSGLTRGEPLVSAAVVMDQNLDTATAALNVGQSVVTGVTASGSAIAANTYAGGFMMVVDGQGEGTAYRIRDHTAFSAGASDGSVVLDDVIAVASDADTQVSFLKNKFADPMQSRTMQGDPFVGVPLVTVPDGSTTTQYFWAQRVGFCPVFCVGAPIRGTSMVISTTDLGRLQGTVAVHDVQALGVMHALDTNPSVGVMATNAINDEVQVVDLRNSMF